MLNAISICTVSTWDLFWWVGGKPSYGTTTPLYFKSTCNFLQRYRRSVDADGLLLQRFQDLVIHNCAVLQIIHFKNLKGWERGLGFIKVQHICRQVQQLLPS